MKIFHFARNEISCKHPLNIPKYEKSGNINHIEDPITRSSEQYKIHPSIVAIKSKNKNKYFKFNSISKSEIEKETLNLDSSKARQDSDIPKKSSNLSDIFTDTLYLKRTNFPGFCGFRSLRNLPLNLILAK